MKKCLLPIVFLVAMSFASTAQQNSGKVKSGFGLTVVQEQAEFPGGNDSLQAFLKRNLIYPEKSKKEKVSGKVYVSYNISAEGKIEGVKIISGVNPELDNEALRVVKQMPAWKPGTVSGNPVKVQYILPIDFIVPTFNNK